MLFNFHKNHKELVLTLFIMYTLLSILIAVVPAFEIQNNNGPLPGQKDLTEQERNGLKVFIANGCVACHTQQVRDIEMDAMWGSRPTLPADYYYSKERMDSWQQSPSLLGSERTGPDLTNVGQRLPSDQWQYMHLYNPRAVVPQSIMPAFPWLFEVKAKAGTNDVVVNVPEEFRKGIKGELVATQKAKDLVAYLLSLKQMELPGNPAFLPTPNVFLKNKSSGKPGGATTSEKENTTASGSANGAALYQSTCSACHQPNGEGLKGAFPSLKESPVVNDEDPTLHIKIVLEGYDARAQYAVMPPFKDQLSDEEIAAIIDYERTNWGNKGKTVTAEDVKKIREEIK